MPDDLNPYLHKQPGGDGGDEAIVATDLPIANPYVGPRALQRGESLYGRKREVLNLVDLMISERIVLLYSASGAGKTSLIEAGLRPSLEEQGFSVAPTMRVSHSPNRDIPLPPGTNRYLLSLLLSLDNRLDPADTTDLGELCRMGFEQYLDAIDATQGDGEFFQVLIFDQFEEVLTLDRPEEEIETERVEFFEEVGHALRKRHRWAIFSMREDYIAGLDPYCGKIPTRLSHTFRLELLKTASASESIYGPASEVGVEFRADAVERLVTDLSKVKSYLPSGESEEHPGLYVEPVQLQVVCRRLWSSLADSGGLDDRVITLEEVREKVGAVDDALAAYYRETVYRIAGDCAVDERAIRDWFDRRLMAKSGIRVQVQEGPIPGIPGEEDVIQALRDAFLVRTENRRGANWFELAHDRLVRPIAQDNDDWRLRNLSPLQRRSDLWQSEGRPDGLLLKGSRLREQEEWAKDRGDDISPIDLEFLQACRRNRRAHWRGAALVVLAFLVAGLTAMAINNYIEKKLTNDELEDTVTQLEVSNERLEDTVTQLKGIKLASQPHTLLLESQRQLNRSRHTESALLARQAYLYKKRLLSSGLAFGKMKIEAQQIIDDETLFHKLAAPLSVGYFSHVIPADSGVASNPAVVAGLTSVGAVRSVAFDSSRRLLAAGGQFGEQGIVRLWDLDKKPHRPRPALMHQSLVRSVAFDPLNGQLVTAGNDGRIRVWTLDTGDQGKVGAHEPNTAVRAVVFAPSSVSGTESSLMASAGEDGTVRLWRRTDDRWEEAFHPLRHAETVRSVAFHPNGTTLASTSSDGLVRLWHFRTGNQAAVLNQHPAHLGKNGVRAVAFHPNGRFMATAGPVQPGNRGRFGPGVGRATRNNETQVESWGVLLWDLKTPNQPRLLDPPLRTQHEVRSLAFSSSGDRLFASNSGGEVLSWPARPSRVPASGELEYLQGHKGWVFQVAVDPEDRFVASAGRDGTVRLWEKNTRTPIEHKFNSAVRSITFSPKAAASAHSVTAIGTANGKVHLYNLYSDAFELAATQPAPANSTSNSDPTVRAVAFSRKGEYLVSAGSNSEVNLWSTSKLNEPPKLLEGLGKKGMSAVAFGTHSTFFAAGDDRKIFRGRLNAGQPIPNFEGQVPIDAPAAVRSLAVSHDGRWLAIATWSDEKKKKPDPTGRVRLWEVRELRNSPTGKNVNSNDLPIPSPRQEDELSEVSKSAFSSVAFSPDDEWVAAGSWDGTVRLWRLGRPPGLPREFNGGQGRVSSIAFSPDGRYLASGHESGQVLLWEVDKLSGGASSLASQSQATEESQHDIDFGTQPIVFRDGHKGWVFAVAFSPAGDLLFSGGEGGWLRSWELPARLSERICDVVARNLSPVEWSRYIGRVEYECTCPQLGPVPSMARCPEEPSTSESAG